MAVSTGDPGTSMLTFKVKLLHEQSDMTVEVLPSDSCMAILQQIRAHQNWGASKHVRLICSGKELHPEDPVSCANASVLHCIATDGAPPGYAASQKAAGHATSVEQPPLDMLDVVDPGTVLMWIFGSILALLWVLFIFSASMFDKTSLVMLCIMTVAFLIPCMLSHLPWLPTVAGPGTGSARQPLGSYSSSGSYHTLNAGYGSGSGFGADSSSMQQRQWPGALFQRQWGGQGYHDAGAIPPRPTAQRRPAPATS